MLENNKNNKQNRRKKFLINKIKILKTKDKGHKERDSIKITKMKKIIKRNGLNLNHK